MGSFSVVVSGLPLKMAQLVSLFGLLILFHVVYSAPFAKKSDESGIEKRPFCNAFTGCGRKRSDPSFDFLNDDQDLDDFDDEDFNFQAVSYLIF